MIENDLKDIKYMDFVSINYPNSYPTIGVFEDYKVSKIKKKNGDPVIYIKVSGIEYEDSEGEEEFQIKKITELPPITQIQ